MGNDLVNAVIELVTNADDSYLSLEDRNQLRGDARIRIEIERHQSEPTILRVRDRAEGMSREDVRERLQREGDLYRSFEPDSRQRGMFGSGAKEVSHFGEVIFETIRGDQYTRFVIPRGGGGGAEQPSIGSESPDRHRDELGIPQNGTVVTIRVDSQQFRIPRFDTLRDRLQRAPQLRPIIQDPNRTVELVDLARTDKGSETLVYREPEAVTVIDSEPIPIPGFKSAIEQSGLETELTLKRATEPADDLAGVLIRAGRTAFELDKLGLTNQPHADRIFGEVRCPFFWRLIAEAEARDANDKSLLPHGRDDEYLVERSKNPSRPISRRRRSGLDRTHPFVRNLRGALRPKVNSERQRSLSQEAQPDEATLGEDLQDELDEIAERLGNFLEGLRGEQEEEFSIIPAQARIEPGEKQSFSIQATYPLVEREGNSVEVVVLEGEDFVTVEEDQFELEPKSEFHKGTFSVRGVSKGEATLLAAIGRETESLHVGVGEEKEEEFDELLAIDRKQYTVRSDGSRSPTVRVMVADQLVDTVGKDRAQISLTGDAGISEVVVLSDPQPILKRREGRWEGECKLQGGRGGAGKRGRVTIQYGSSSASARVRVVAHEPDTVGDELPFEIEYLEGVDPSKRRYDWRTEDGQEILSILTEHPSVRPYFQRDSEGTVRRTPELTAVTREVCAGAVAYRTLSERAEGLEGTEEPQPEELIAAFEQMTERALRRLYDPS